MIEYYQKAAVGIPTAVFYTKSSFKIMTILIKELILDIASWISIKFYDKCNKVIINYFVKV
ncbi:hypothetical protein DH26_gp078 [Chloriridovirus anopheles1]|uniref:Uncharacterized protein n=1 Tax=Chloriridovirus anopheles1 TaxID=1465751 RepID=W8R9N9_9VIRU|nr:hypothetical protein DH26_gp078 [Anopheles minimus iridovirus]AHL67571.1 hypothetical protein AMIV_078 [Anopheles minimus iridovirus]